MDVSAESSSSRLPMKEVKQNEDPSSTRAPSSFQWPYEHRIAVEDVRGDEGVSRRGDWRDALPAREVSSHVSRNDVPSRRGWQQLHLWRRESAFPSGADAGAYAAALLDWRGGVRYGYDSSGQTVRYR